MSGAKINQSVQNDGTDAAMTGHRDALQESSITTAAFFKMMLKSFDILKSFVH